jgi:hypothetical protein
MATNTEKLNNGSGYFYKFPGTLAFVIRIDVWDYHVIRTMITDGYGITNRRHQTNKEETKR